MTSASTIARSMPLAAVLLSIGILGVLPSHAGTPCSDFDDVEIEWERVCSSEKQSFLIYGSGVVKVRTSGWVLPWYKKREETLLVGNDEISQILLFLYDKRFHRLPGEFVCFYEKRDCDEEGNCAIYDDCGDGCLLSLRLRLGEVETTFSITESFLENTGPDVRATFETFQRLYDNFEKRIPHTWYRWDDARF